MDCSGTVFALLRLACGISIKESYPASWYYNLTRNLAKSENKVNDMGNYTVTLRTNEYVRTHPGIYALSTGRGHVIGIISDGLKIYGQEAHEPGVPYEAWENLQTGPYKGYTSYLEFRKK